MEVDESKYYFTGKMCKNGHVDKRFKHNGACYSCVQEASRSWYRKKKETIPDASVDDQIEYWVSKHTKPEVSKDYMKSLCYAALKQFEDISFSNERTSNKLMWASIDRIDSSLGYCEGNILIVPMWLNMMKSDASIEEVVATVIDIDWESILDYYS